MAAGLGTFSNIRELTTLFCFIKFSSAGVDTVLVLANAFAEHIFVPLAFDFGLGGLVSSKGGSRLSPDSVRMRASGGGPALSSRQKDELGARAKSALISFLCVAPSRFCTCARFRVMHLYPS